MFGIEDPGIIIAYLMAVGCLVFAAWFGISRWNKEDKNSDNPKDKKS